MIAAMLLLVTSARFTIGFNVLAIFPFSGKSHFHMFRAVSDALVARGHDITVVSHFPKSERPTNHQAGTYTDYSLVGTVPMYENFTTEQVMGNGYLDEFLAILQDGVENCEGIMASGRINNLIRSHNAQFDLVLVEIFNTGCFVSVANQFGAPIIGITSTSLYPWYSGMVGDVMMPSYVPVNLLPFTSQMTFVQRVINTFTLLTMKMFYKYKFELKAQEIIEKHLGKLNGTVSESMDNVNAIIVNTHYVFGDARPTPPGIIQVGGCTYQNPKPLPKDLDNYVTNAKRGVIYFSMGSIVKGSSMPIERSLAMLRAFARMEGYKVLWKWEDDLPSPEVRPDNVMFVPWMPQFEILNHPNVKLFISHGGLMGILDSLYSGVPIIGIPMFADQFSNTNFIVQNGCGLQLQLDRIDEQSVYDTISTVLENDKYMKNAKRLSGLYRDRDLDALEMAVFWIEYVSRHRVGLMLKPEMGHRWYEHYLLDVIITIFVSVTIVAYLTRLAIIKGYETINRFVVAIRR